MNSPQAAEPVVYKRDSFGRVERVQVGQRVCVRRVAEGGRCPGSRWLAGRLLERERGALARLAGLPGLPQLLENERSADGARGAPRELLRTHLDGEPLHQCTRLAQDFFERLEELVRAMHARGVAHNDLHKEQNVIVTAEGWPGLVDFQLASLHPRGGALFRSRARDDLRHVHKHARRYARAGAPRTADEPRLPPRSLVAKVWKHTGKPLYVFITRRVLRRRDGEARRASSGPWPQRSAPLGPWPASALDRLAAAAPTSSTGL